VAEGEEKPFVAVVATSMKSGQSFEASLRAGIKCVLPSPKFLYFHESPGLLDDHALASRLSSSWTERAEKGGQRVEGTAPTVIPMTEGDHGDDPA
jgi:hypothetical protein